MRWQLCAGHDSPEPHVLPRCRFMVLAYMPVMEHAPAAYGDTFPFAGGPRTPPPEIDSIQMAGGHPAVQHLVRFLNWN